MSHRIARLTLMMFAGLISMGAANMEQVSESVTLSQLIRSNSPHFWAYAKSTAQRAGDVALYGFKGTLAGDPHLGNFSVTRVYTTTGEARLQYINLDLDDAGHGPLFFDFARLVVTIEAINGKLLKKSHLEDAYIKGLSGRRLAPPRQIQEALDLSVAEYESRARAYVEKKAPQGKFKLKAGELEAYTGPIDRNRIERARPGIKVLDLAQKIEQRGGSLNQLRLWALTQDTQGVKRIIELKEWAETALAHYEPQDSPLAWQERVQETFWTGLDRNQYSLTNLGAAGWFWIREKKVNLIDIPYTSRDPSDLEFLRQASLFAANSLGIWHGRQSAGHDLLISIARDRAGFHSILNDFVDSYLEVEVPDSLRRRAALKSTRI